MRHGGRDPFEGDGEAQGARRRERFVQAGGELPRGHRKPRGRQDAMADVLADHGAGRGIGNVCGPVEAPERGRLAAGRLLERAPIAREVRDRTDGAGVLGKDRHAGLRQPRPHLGRRERPAHADRLAGARVQSRDRLDHLGQVLPHRPALEQERIQAGIGRDHVQRLRQPLQPCSAGCRPRA